MIDRALGKKIVSMAKKFPVVSLTGPRQSGKTTLARALFPQYAYVNLENLNDRAAAQEDPVRFLKAFAEKGVVIDEAQKLPELFSYLQVVADESGKMGRFILTGSQNFLLLENISQSLAGRVAVFHLMPFGLKELDQAGLLTSEVDNLLFAGTYPVLYDRQVAAPDYYPSYIQTYIERDVRSIKNIGDLAAFQRCVRLCAGRTGQLLNLSSLGDELGINYKTVSSWISILEASFIVFLLKPHYKNFNKRVVKQSKLYFFDTGLLCSLLDIQSPDQLRSHYLRGSIFETFVVAEYVKHRFHSGARSNAFFWRDSTGHEIDLLIEEGNTFRAVEIKSGETLASDFFKGLDFFSRISGLTADNCFLIYGGAKGYDRASGRVLGWKDMPRIFS
ncbi:MAG: ATP-binding protein [Thermodesulfobacteriota bacterium]